MEKIRVGVLGSTGSIGRQTLSVIDNHRDLFSVELLSCKTNVELLDKQVAKFQPRTIIRGESALLANPDTYKNCDVVVNGISGLAGLKPTLAVIMSPARLATANKESLVAFGEGVMSLAKKFKKELIPVDSEHSAIYQCLENNSNVEKLILTASGGAFRGKTREELQKVTAKDALNHPTWVMGAKVTIDSATLMNKGFELIEAKHLFNTKNIEVLIHNESIIHSLVEYKDGAVKALLSSPDMVMPIQYALTAPNRYFTTMAPLKLHELGTLTFTRPDRDRFPCLRIAEEVLANGNDYEGAVMTATDELAVKLYLENKIGFYDISDMISNALNYFGKGNISCVDDVIRIDNEVKAYFNIIDRN